MAILLIFSLCSCNSHMDKKSSYTLDTFFVPPASDMLCPIEYAEDMVKCLNDMSYSEIVSEDCIIDEVFAILDISISDDTIIFECSGAWLGLVKSFEKTVQCVYGGTDIGGPYMHQGFGGDYIRYALELLWADSEGYIPRAFINIGTSDMLLVLLVQKSDKYSIIWYDDLLSVLATTGIVEGDYAAAISNVDDNTAYKFKELSFLCAGYNRYLNAIDGKEISYLSCKWLPE